MEHTYEDLTQKFKCENEGREMDIEGNVIKVELKPPLTQIQKLPNVKLENAKQVEHNVEIKSESQAQNEDNQNALSKTEEAKNIKLGGKQLNSKEESSAMKKVLQRK